MPDFSRISLIVRREWLTRLRQRSFQITTIVQVLFVVAASSLPAIISRFAGDSGPSTSTVLVLDDANADIITRLEPYVTTSIQDAGTTIHLQAEAGSADDARATIDAKDADGALIVTRSDDSDLSFSYINRNGEFDSTAQLIYGGISQIAIEDRLARSGVSPAETQAAMAPPVFAISGATPPSENDDGAVNGTKVALAYFFTILMFMTIMLYGTWVAQGVVEEKSSRIMEIMVNAATPRDLLAGKILGIGAAGITQLLPMLLAGGLVFGLQKPIARAIGANPDGLPDVNFGEVSFTAVGWFLIYFLLGFTLYAALYASLGSLVSRQEEVNQAVSPMMTVMMLGYFSAFFTMFMPEALYSRILSIFPLTAPFVMISRVIIHHPPAWEMIASIVLLASSVILAILFAGRIYRMGVLWYGQKPSWKTIFTRGLEQAAR